MKSLLKSIFLFSIQALLLGSLSAAMITRPADPLPANGDTKDGLVASTAGTGLEGHRWSYNDSSWSKAFDVVGNNRYGNDGYVLFAASETMGSIPATSVTQGASVVNPSLNIVSLPGYIASITYANSGTVAANTSNYNVAITKPNPSSVSDTVFAGVFEIPTSTYTQDTSAEGKNWYYGAALTITLSQDAHFRMGIMSDFVASALGPFVADGFRLQNEDGTGAAYTLGYGPTATGPTAGYAPDMFFFDVEGLAGDVLVLYAANDVNNRSALFNGLTFDTVIIPEPSTVALIIGLVALMPVLWCRRRQSK